MIADSRCRLQTAGSATTPLAHWLVGLGLGMLPHDSCDMTKYASVVPLRAGPGKSLTESMTLLVKLGHSCSQVSLSAAIAIPFLGVFVTREHVRHNKSGIAHLGRTRINHLRELPTKFNHFAAVGGLPRPAESVNHRCTFGMRGAEKLGRQPGVPKSRAAFINLEKQVIPRAALGAQNGGHSYETVC
jgi:hypothetical protein